VAGSTLLDPPADAEQEVVCQSFERNDRRKKVVAVNFVERADPLLQKFSWHLEDRLRKAVVEAQLVGAVVS